MSADSELDAGLDARLETYPRHQVALLLAAPWLLLPADQDAGTAFLTIIPVGWLGLHWIRARARRR